MNKELKKSVRDIVDFLYASGDLMPAFSLKNNMQEGIRIHQQVATHYPDCEKEYYVKTELNHRNYQIMLQGRIDLLGRTANLHHIIEVKSTSVLDDDLEHKYPNHFAQAKFYGYMLLANEGAGDSDEIVITVLYVHKYSRLEKPFTKTYTFAALRDFFFHSLEQYLDFVEMIDQFKTAKLASIKEMPFPYPKLRKGQDELIAEVYQCLEAGEDLFVCAPTGIGKSLGTIYPALKASHSTDKQIFYLTAKGVVKEVARGAVNTLRSESQLCAKSLTITAKEKICLNHEVKCNPNDCPYARNFYGKLKGALIDLYQHEDDFYDQTIKVYAEKHELCPFELQLELSLLCDLIICDYNYVFDPRVYLRRFFDLEQPEVFLLIDEAHNMYDRVTGMYTIVLTTAVLAALQSLVSDHKVLQRTAALISKLEQYQSRLQYEERAYLKYHDLDLALLHEVELLVGQLEKYFESLVDFDEAIPNELLDCYFNLTNFLKISEFYSQDFIVWVTNEQNNLSYQITCLNPRELVKLRTQQVEGTIFFSATLHPLDYFIYLLGGNENSKYLSIPSPFMQENLNLLVNDTISTKYNDREKTKLALTKQIHEIVKIKGKYLVYFPSYAYLELIYQELENLKPSFTLLKQSQNMTELEQRVFIDQFDTSTRHVVGFAVLGGVFSEGIDLKGERLNGVVVVGVGLPTFDAFRKELQAYFNSQGLNGYRYAYTYPGFNKVMQAVGRVIRQESDQGLALLIDSRYKTYEYLKLFPSEWSHFVRIT